MSPHDHHPSDVDAINVNSNDDDIQDLAFSKRGCCFWVPCLNSEPSHGGASAAASSSSFPFWQRINENPYASADPWWARGWKKLREWSEIVAGPKWKNFIRRFNKRKGNARQGYYGKFQYDPESYSLNFDDGPGHERHFDEDLLGRGFSSRYSLPPSAKSSMDFDREGLVVT